MFETWQKQVDSYFSPDKLNEFIELTKTLVNMDSFTYDGEDVNAVGECVTSWLAARGFSVQKLPRTFADTDEPWMKGVGNVFMARSHPAEAGAGVVFLGHLDTVFPRGTVKERPFSIQGDRAMGPGVDDMKGGVVMNMMAAAALKELGLLDFPVTLVFSCDEEMGAPTSTRTYAPLLKGAVAALVTEPGTPGGGVTTQRKGSGHVHMCVTGKMGHSSRDYKTGASAILDLAHKIVDLDKLVDFDKEILVNTGLVAGGISPGTIAPDADARIHLSYVHMDEGERLMEGVRAVAATTYVPGTTTILEGGLRLPPLEPTQKGGELFAMAERAAASIGMKLNPIFAKGASEAGFTSTRLGIPSLCGLGPEGTLLHSDKEYLLLPTVLPRCKMLTLTAIQAAKAFMAAR